MILDKLVNSRLLGRAFPAVLLIAFSSCTTFPPDQSDLRYPRPSKDLHLTCTASRADRCAEPSRLLDRAYVAAAQEENLATILDVGDEALVAVAHLVRSARATIDVQTFIWADDAVGHFIFRELLAAARRGVRVRIIADQMFSTQPAEVLAWIAAAHQNLTLKLYNPVGGRGDTSIVDYVLQSPVDFDNVNSRMHNKLLVVDGVCGITGGRNITNEYYDRGRAYNYLDRDVLTLGSVVMAMQISFDEYWNHGLSVDVDQLEDVHQRLFVDGNQVVTPTPETVDLIPFDDVLDRALSARFVEDRFLDAAYPLERVLFQADSPGKGSTPESENDRNTTLTLRDAILGSVHSVVLQSPYFVLSKPTSQALETLRQGKPGIEFIMSTNSLASTDAYYVYALSFKRKKSYVKDLQFRIFELKPHPGDLAGWMPRLANSPAVVDQTAATQAGSEFGKADLLPLVNQKPRVGIHQKSMVIDDRLAVIGSHNFDPRSAMINTEAALLVWDNAFAVALRRSIARATQPHNSWVIAPQQQVPLLGHVSGFFGSISRALPLFDLWPFRYSSSFELKQGHSPAPPTEPTFYERYRDVGQFPGVALSPKDVVTRLISAFGGLAEPQM